MVAALLLGALGSASHVVVADLVCELIDPWPSFAAAAPSARTVFVGTVTEIGPGGRTVFTLDVDEILRGNAPSVIRFDGFRSGVPLIHCPHFPADLRVRTPGEQLAFAMDAKADGVPGRIDAVAFVGDSKPSRFYLPGMEQLPLTKVRRLAGRAADGSTSSSPRGPSEGPISRAVVKRVAPGVWRVIDDRTGRDVDRVRLVEAGPDGTVWIAGTQLLSELGRAGTIRKPLRYISALDSTPDGELIAIGQHAATYDGKRWTRLVDEQADPPRRYLTFVSDGSAWAGSDPAESRETPGAARWDGATWSITDRRCDCLTTGFAEDAAGDIWMGVKGWSDFEGDSGAGLFRLEDGLWHDADPFPDTGPTEVYGITAGQDGIVWAILLPESADGERLGDYSASVLARWDGASWTAYEWPSWASSVLERINPYRGSLGYNKAFSPDMEVSPDGTLWFKQPLMSFDGETWRSYSVPTRDTEGPRVSDLSIDPEGMVWLSVRDFTDPVPGRPHRLFVLDPERADPSGLESVVVREGSGR